MIFWHKFATMDPVYPYVGPKSEQSAVLFELKLLVLHIEDENIKKMITGIKNISPHSLAEFKINGVANSPKDLNWGTIDGIYVEESFDHYSVKKPKMSENSLTFFCCWKMEMLCFMF